MFRFNVDLGQLIIAGLIGTVGWFVKRTVDSFDKRIEKHEAMLFQMSAHVQRILGRLEVPSENLYRRGDDK